jgi:lysozyme family protein
MSDSNDHAAGLIGAGATAATAATLAKTGVPVSVILAAAITAIVIASVVYLKVRQTS